ncbi:putative nuclear matrix constituent protein 1-like protein [Acorus calamus]|uniref:Nuclear matrix constituent protein 1-like protein n=1 Tax=Acorus calamus TaxID=4465 RepID=A0AAV9DJ73_ACOCL|nr:putative nuclear matrix constituent protein 1-like protein [Acorus calamus]
MASPSSGGRRTPAPVYTAQITGGSPWSEEAVWKRLREAGFEEGAIRRRDKAALIGFIAKLEAEIFDYQHHMGLLLLERKELTSKYEAAKAASAAAETLYRRDQTEHLSALAEARKREEGLKKSLAIERECLKNIEKTLHEMRTESAEVRVSSESKLSEAQKMIETAEERFVEVGKKKREVDSLQAEVSRLNSAADRKLKEVEAREDELRRQIMTFKSECVAKEKAISLERHSLFESQKVLEKGQEGLLLAQASLNQREDNIFRKSQELSQREKDLESERASTEKEHVRIKEERSKLDQYAATLGNREEAVIKKEMLLDKMERELLILKEKLASKEHDEIQKAVAKHEASLELGKLEFEAGLERKLKLMEDGMQSKRLALELQEADLCAREKAIKEKEHDLDVKTKFLQEEKDDMEQKLKFLEEKSESLNIAAKAAEEAKLKVQNEMCEIDNMKQELQKLRESIESEKKQLFEVQEKLEITRSERDEVLVLKEKLKEEIDNFRTQQVELMAETDKMKVEKEKFEKEWELIDERRESLQKEVESINEERRELCRFLENERNSIKLEKDALHAKFKDDLDLLALERQAFLEEMKHEHSEWFKTTQQERIDFIEELKIQKRELEDSIKRRQEEMETNLKEKEEIFKQEKAEQLQIISSEKEFVAKEMQHIASEMKKLESERSEMALDQEWREKEWGEINASIEGLREQTEKLHKQRELLQADRKEIDIRIRQLKELEASNAALSHAQLHIGPNMQHMKKRRKYSSEVATEEDTLKRGSMTSTSTSSQDNGNDLISSNPASGYKVTDACTDGNQGADFEGKFTSSMETKIHCSQNGTPGSPRGCTEVEKMHKVANSPQAGKSIQPTNGTSDGLKQGNGSTDGVKT